MFYSKSTGGFYDADIHGTKTIEIPDPAWLRPTVEIQDPQWMETEHPEGTHPTLIEVPDESAQQPTIQVSNPDYKMPVDVVEITAEQHAALLEGQSQGKVITSDAEGFPVLADPPTPTDDELKARCATDAKQRLLDTDWSQLGDVASTLTNKSAFDAYRAAVRALVLEPVTAPTFPERPSAVWA